MKPSSLALVVIYGFSSCFAEVCFWNGHAVDYCGHGKYCCSRAGIVKCCLNEEIGLNIYGLIGLAMFGLAVFIFTAVVIIRQCKSRINGDSGTMSSVHLHNANQQQGLVFISPANLDLPPSYETAYKMHSTEELPPPYSSQFHPPYSNV